MHQWKEFKSSLTFCLGFGDSVEKLDYSVALQGRCRRVLPLQRKALKLSVDQEKDITCEKGLRQPPRIFGIDLRRIRLNWCPDLS